MLPECLALVAAICLNQSAKVEVISDSIWSGARIEVDGAEIISVIRSDSGLFPDRRRMSRYCSGSTCVYYHAYCTGEGQRYLCKIFYNQPGDGFSRMLEIRVADQSSMTSLLERLHLAVPGAQHLISLAAFRERSHDSSSPWCRPREDSGCR